MIFRHSLIDRDAADCCPLRLADKQRAPSVLDHAMNIRASFIQRASDTSPAINAAFRPDSGEKPTTIKVEHRLGSPADRAGRQYLRSLNAHAELAELIEFYKLHDGVQFCRTRDARHDEVRPMLELKPASTLAEFTNRYRPGGDCAWTMDLNKSRSIYRGTESWLAFAEITSGPSCLTIFLTGPHAGKISYVTPQPSFNILRPIANSFQTLLARIVADVPAFFRLVRATIAVRGPDGQNYGLQPLEYLPTGKIASKTSRRTKRSS